ncbi:ABC-type ATPase involved in cell division [Enterococcus sp. PF1-24]|uniref:cell division ATP-binding protein FtsE n=1 Tax=unclassified Enterococcus TaxID=2608891 RepID=UPI00247435F7|nr:MULTISPECIES: ATP-binding cassette domain-containing protein [unclassified Enterococcus]MDH6365688.1 ABC-type ATPase involved in cell division [Enterococcus sp. PFB1-1]MDH6402786.1 ABC-type ATPase involved in cell division [Enterococcus sp. PF1-24]
MLSFDKVTIQSPTGEIILKEITENFPKAEISYLTGKSGVGKTTLLKAILGEVPIAQGKISLNQQAITYDNLANTLANRRKIGVIYQDFRLLEELTVFENIAYVLYRQELAEASIKAEVEKIAAELGIKDKLASYCHELSGGEQQRVAIARAIAMNPEMILADEPTGNLDPLKAKEIVALLHDLSVKRRLAVLLVTHDYTLIPAESSHVYQIAQQKINRVAVGEIL